MFSLLDFHNLNKLSLSNLAIAMSIFLILIVLFYNVSLVPSTPQVVLQVVSPEKSDMYQLFYDTGKDFNETESVKHAVDKGDNIKDVIFGLPVSLSQVKSIRIDPGSQPALIKIKSIQLISDGKEYHWNAAEILQNFRPVMDIGNSYAKDGLLHINSTGRDPAFVSNFDFNIFSQTSYLTINLTKLSGIEGLSYLMVAGILIVILLSLLSQKFGGALTWLEKVNFYTCIVLFAIANIIFFYKLQRIVYPFPYHDEFINIIPTLSSWADGTLTLGQFFEQKSYLRPFVYFTFYIVMAELFGENFYSISIYLVYISTAIITLIMLFKEKTNKLLWLGVLLIAFTSRTTSIHFWLFTTLFSFFLIFLPFVGFYLIEVNETKKSGFVYSGLILVSISCNPIFFSFIPFFLTYHFFNNKFANNLVTLRSLPKTLLISIKRVEGYLIATTAYVLCYVIYFHNFKEYAPVPGTMNMDFLLNFVGGLFVEMVSDVKPIGLALIVIMTLLTRNLKTTLVSLAFLTFVLILTWQRSGFGEMYAFQSRYYVYSAFVFLILILNAEVVKNNFYRYFLQWLFLLFIVVSFSKWATSDYDVRFSEGKQIAFNAYLNNDFWGTEKTKLVHPSLTAQEWQYFLNTVEHGYFPKAKSAENISLREEKVAPLPSPFQSVPTVQEESVHPQTAETDSAYPMFHTIPEQVTAKETVTFWRAVKID